jgi:RimJ/RimL family protein N-acetyltransferase
MTSLKDQLPASLTSARLRLDPPHEGDVAALVGLADNDNISRWTASLPFPYGEDDARRFLSEIANGPKERTYAIRLADGSLIGVAGIMVGGELPEIGYWIGEPYWRQGYGGEALGAIVAAIEASGFAGRIAARVIAENAASLPMLAAQGFLPVRQATGDCGRNVGKQIIHLERLVLA